MDDALLYAAAPGKINLYLKVTGRRENGYHELESLFLPLACPADDVAVDCDMLPGAITVGTSDIMIPGGLQNIAGKAAELWAKKTGTVPHWDINIAKNIPVAAGMGGGSSDAAAVLKLLNDHAGKPLNDAELAAAALELGADVPFFLDARPAIMTGIGEVAEPLEFALPELNILLIAPGFPVSAKEGYSLMDSNCIAPMDEALRGDILNSLRSNDIEKLSQLLFNDLQAGVFHKYPLLKMLTQEVRECGALNALMTGSGPTLFALFASNQAADQAAAAMQAAHSEFKITRARQ